MGSTEVVCTWVVKWAAVGSSKRARTHKGKETCNVEPHAAMIVSSLAPTTAKRRKSTKHAGTPLSGRFHVTTKPTRIDVRRSTGTTVQLP